MSSDVTVVATAAISAAAAVGGAWIGLLAGRQQIRAEDARQRAGRAQARRDERKAAYGVALDLITDWLWDTRYPPPGYDVLVSFTKPFVHAANAVRVYGSDQAFKAVERFQAALDGLNDLNDKPDATDAEAGQVWEEVYAALDDVFDSARADVGPAAEDFAKRAAAAKSG
jgi:hypothetical protein